MWTARTRCQRLRPHARTRRWHRKTMAMTCGPENVGLEQKCSNRFPFTSCTCHSVRRMTTRSRVNRRTCNHTRQGCLCLFFTFVILAMAHVLPECSEHLCSCIYFNAVAAMLHAIFHASRWAVMWKICAWLRSQLRGDTSADESVVFLQFCSWWMLMLMCRVGSR